MKNFKHNEQAFLPKLSGFLFIICSFLLIAGCSNPEAANEAAPADTNKQAIQAVIEKEFNGPDEKYRELWENATEIQTAEMDQEEYNAWLETTEYQEYIQYMEEAYSPYFTENGYETFINTSAFSYSFSDAEYNLNTTEIEITQSENESTLYNFTFVVSYENEDGETSQYNFDGNTIVPQKGKIGKIQFNDQDGLTQQIR